MGGAAAGAPAAGARRCQQLDEVGRIRRRRVDAGVERLHPGLAQHDAARHLHAVHAPIVRVVELDQQVAHDRVIDARLDLRDEVLGVDVAGHGVGLPRRRLQVRRREGHHLQPALTPHRCLTADGGLQEAPRCRPDIERLRPGAAGLRAGDVLVEDAGRLRRYARDRGRLRWSGGARDQGRRFTCRAERERSRVSRDRGDVDRAHRLADGLALAEGAVPRCPRVGDGVQRVDAHRLRGRGDNRRRVLGRGAGRQKGHQQNGHGYRFEPHRVSSGQSLGFILGERHGKSWTLRQRSTPPRSGAVSPDAARPSGSSATHGGPESDRRPGRPV